MMRMVVGTVNVGVFQTSMTLTDALGNTILKKRNVTMSCMRN